MKRRHQTKTKQNTKSSQAPTRTATKRCMICETPVDALRRTDCFPLSFHAAAFLFVALLSLTTMLKPDSLIAFVLCDAYNKLLITQNHTNRSRALIN